MASGKAFGWFCGQAVFQLIVLIQLYDCKERPRITSLYACTDIKYRFATTRITSHVINPTNRSRQAVFDITLPNDAFISNFTLTVEGQTYPGRVGERWLALRQYGANATLGTYTAGRVSQRPRETNQFRVTLKVAPFQGATFNLTYQEILERRLGFYNHVLYIDPGQPVEDLRVDVSIEENRPITYLHVPPIRSDLLSDFNVSETNSLVRVERPSGRHAYISYHPTVRQQQVQGMSSQGLSGLFTVRYDVSRSMDAGELLSVNGFFVHFLAPPVQELIPKDVLFILDTSTSMMWQKLGQLQDAMRVILQDLAPGDRFALMQFNSRAAFWRRELLPVSPWTIHWALQYVDSLKARGYTNIDSALAQGLEFFNEDNTVTGNNSLIIFLTDGRPTRGETDGNKISRHVRAQNVKNVTIYGLAFGKDADWPLVKKMASQNHGVGRRIYQDADAALQIHGFYDEVSTLLLTGVQAVYLDSQVDMETLTRTFFRQFFNGSEMVVAGKLIRLNQTALQVLVRATGLKGQVNLTIVPDPDPLTPGQVRSCGVLKAEDLTRITEKMWAYLTLRQLLQRRVGEDDPRVKQQLRNKATALALRYNFVTPVTSLVVSKPGAEELALLQEDASDLLDELDPWLSGVTIPPLPPRPTTPTTTTLKIATTQTTSPSSRPSSSASPTDMSVPETITVPPTTSNLPESSTADLPTETSSPPNSAVRSATMVSREMELFLRNAARVVPERFIVPESSFVSREAGSARPTASTSTTESPTASTSTTESILPEITKAPPGTMAPENSAMSDADKIADISGSSDGNSDPESSALDRGKDSVVASHSVGSAGSSSSSIGSNSRVSRGGGGGDPHFMVEMTSLPYPLCYDVKGDTGDVFRLLRDPQTGLTVNVEIGKGRRKPPGSSRVPVYITKAAILLQDIIAEVTTAHAKVNDFLLQWDTTQSVYVPGVWLMMKNSTLRFALDWSVEIDVTRHVPKGANGRGETFFNVEIQNEAKLSKESTGLLGQFVHKDVRLQRIKKREGRLVAELEITDDRGGHPHVGHGRALLKARKDPYFRRLAFCLMVDALWSHTMDRPTRFYKIHSLYEI